MKIIPTPEKHVFSADTKPLLGFSNIEFSVNIDDTVSFALSEIHKAYAVPNGRERLVLSYSDDEFFLAKNATEQGYTHRYRTDIQVLLFHHGDCF